MHIYSHTVKIKTDDNLMETAQHGSRIFPFRFYYENMADFDFHCIDWHWHAELEFVWIKSGTVHFRISDKQIDLSEGSGIFINSKILHYMVSPGEACIPNFLCLASFIAPADSLIYDKYVRPIIESSIDYLAFSPDIPWQAEVLTEMKAIANAHSSDDINELMISARMQKLWFHIVEHVDCPRRSNSQAVSPQARLQIMMQLIHEKYASDLSLLEIAEAANISKSTALGIFHKILSTTPIDYLIKYRLQEAAVLLLNTEKKINAISLETGFNNVDYFCKTFKKLYGMTPTEYRKGKKTLIL